MSTNAETTASVTVRTQFLQQPLATEAAEGSNVTLHCKLNLSYDSNGQGPVTAQWYRDSHALYITKEVRYSYIDDNMYNTGDFTMHISNVQVDHDSAEFYCEWQRDQLKPEDRPVSHTATLTVLVPPQSVVMSLIGSSSSPDGTLQFLCVSETSNPAGTITWWLDNEYISVDSSHIHKPGSRNKTSSTTSIVNHTFSSDDNNKHLFCHVFTHDDLDVEAISVFGEYMSCNKMNVTVIVPAAYVTMAIDGNAVADTEIMHAGPHKASCTTEKSFPGGTVTWKLGDTSVDEATTSHVSEVDGTITTYSTLMRTFTADDHDKILACHVDIHESLQSLSVEVRLNVQYMGEVRVRGDNQEGVITLNHGSTLWLLCTADGNPPPSYSWLHNGTLITGEGNSTYEKESVTYIDTGDYVCAASNIVGIIKSTNTMSLNVATPEKCNSGLIVGLIIGSLAILIIVIIIGFYMKKKCVLPRVNALMGSAKDCTGDSDSDGTSMAVVKLVAMLLLCVASVTVWTQFLQQPRATEAAEGDFSMHISNVQVDHDSAELYCEWQRDQLKPEDRPVSHTATLTVLVPPQSVVMSLIGSSSSSDGTLQFLCVSDSSNPAGTNTWWLDNEDISVDSSHIHRPEPSYTWLHDDQGIQAASDEMAIERVEFKDKGFYSCQAISVFREYMSSNKMNVTVVVAAAYVTMEIDGNAVADTEIMHAGPHKASCTTDKSFPGGTSLSVEVRLNVQYMGEVRVSGDNEEGAITLNHGSTLWLLCTADENPPPSYSWLHNGTLITGEGNSTYEKESVTYIDTGDYVCAASNIVGIIKSTNTMSLDVATPEKFNSGLIVGLIIGSLAILIIVIIIGLYIKKKCGLPRANALMGSAKDCTG
ncbi:PREDICTED: hemicentin-1-like, partial [Priapulus caudatus]|uniref:Hemicentin-1-like n=1 Tax=Priapulus caudatus TaxID=37621 RepID=A0ABM1F3J3_PRICU